jgi:hypothetical protein
MWDDNEGKFWTGTESDGITINRGVIPLDVQAWAVVALDSEERGYRRGLSYAEANLRVGEGFDFNQDRDGIWYEGTAQMAAAYKQAGNELRRREILAALRAAQLPTGALNATSVSRITTGFNLPDGQPWRYFARPHIAATAWAAIAELGINPFE